MPCWPNVCWRGARDTPCGVCLGGTTHGHAPLLGSQGNQTLAAPGDGAPAQIKPKAAIRPRAVNPSFLFLPETLGQLGGARGADCEPWTAASTALPTSLVPPLFTQPTWLTPRLLHLHGAHVAGPRGVLMGLEAGCHSRPKEVGQRRARKSISGCVQGGGDGEVAQ